MPARSCRTAASAHTWPHSGGARNGAACAAWRRAAGDAGRWPCPCRPAKIVLATDFSPAFCDIFLLAVASRLLSMKCKRAAEPLARENHRLGHTGREHVQRPHVHREYAAAVGTLVAAQAARHAWRQRQGKQERAHGRPPGTFARNRVCLVAVGAGGGGARQGTGAGGERGRWGRASFRRRNASPWGIYY